MELLLYVVSLAHFPSNLTQSLKYAQYKFILKNIIRTIRVFCFLKCK